MFLKKLIILLGVILIIAGCDLVDDKKNPTNPEIQELSSLTVNGDTITLESGVYSYRYLLNSSDGDTTEVLIDAKVKDSSVTLTGIGTKTVNNPVVIQDPYNSDSYQESIETDLKIKVTEGDTTVIYTLTISSAPLWAETTLTFSGDGTDLTNGTTWFRLYNQKISKNLYATVDIKPVKTQKIAIPLPIEESLLVNSLLEFHHDFDNDRFDYGDYLGDIKNLEINFSKTEVFQIPEIKMSRVNRVELLNLPAELILSESTWREATIYLRNVNTGEFNIYSDYKLGDGKYIFDSNYTGTYELIVYGPQANDLLFSNYVISLGVYNITETTDLIIDAADFNVISLEELGPTAIGGPINPSTIQVVFSEPMNKDSVESAIKIYDAEKYCKGVEDSSIPLTGFSWNVSNTILEVSHELDENTQFYLIISNSAESASGEKMFFELNPNKLY